MTKFGIGLRRMAAEICVDAQDGLTNAAASRTTAISGAALGTLALAGNASAASDSLNCDSGQQDSAGPLIDTIKTVCTWLTIIGGAIALLMFVWGGFRIVIGGAHKGGDAVRKGMDTIKWAIVGLAIMLGAVFIRGLLIAVVGSSPAANSIDTNCTDSWATN